MKSNTVKYSGIGLIEVLITTVVIALGLLAVARFQVGVIGESRDNKAMVEARNYCESGIEDLRSSMSRSTLDEDGLEVFWASSDGSPFTDNYVGKNATYTRSMVVENLLLPDDATTPDDESVREKRVTATCSWDGGEVELQTVLTLHGANSSALAAGLGGGGGPAISPSLNAGSSDDISDVRPLQPFDEGYGNAGQVVLIEGEWFVVQSNGESAAKSDLCSALNLLSFENGLRARRVDNDGDGLLESVELFEVVLDGLITRCVPRVRFNGGVVIPIRGVVHSRATDPEGQKTLAGLELFTLNVSESGAYCIFNPSEGATSAPYTCYVGGNCAHGPLGDDDTDFTQCPEVALSSALGNVGEGGWRGRVGLLNVAAPILEDGSTSKSLNVCFKEETESSDFGGRDTARSYFSYNEMGTTDVTSDDRSQGINKPYVCQDFLIVDGKSTDRQLNQVCEAEANKISGLQLASKTISRPITGLANNNVYDPIVDATSCEPPETTPSYTINGALLYSVGVPLVQVTAGAIVTDCVVVSQTYSCTFTTAESRVEISAIQGVDRFPQPACSVSLPPLGDGCVIELPNVDPENIYRISGSISGDEVGTRLSSAGGALSLEVQYGANFAASCSVGPHANGGRDYVCEFVDPGTGVVTLAASASSPYVLEYSEPVTLDQNEILGPNLVVTATAVSTRRIYGEIRNINVPLKNNEILTPSINPFGSIDCSQLILESLSNEPGRDRSSYDCTVPAGLLTVDYIVSPGCYRNQGTQYKLELEPSVGTELTNDSGSLSLELNSMTDQQVNVTIKLSPDICEPKPK